MISTERLHDFIREAEKLPFTYGDNLEVRTGELLEKVGCVGVTRNPNGGHSHPDWLAYDDTGHIEVECKSTLAGSSYHFSRTPPKQNVLYVFSSQGYDNTVCRFGSQIFPAELDEYVSKVLTEIAIYNNRTKFAFKTHPLNKEKVYPETQATWRNAAGDLNLISYFNCDAPVFKTQGLSGFFKKCVV